MLTQKQSIFTLKWFEGKTKEESALLAGYKPKWAKSIGSRLSTNVNVLAQYNKLQQKAEDDAIMDKKEILKTLSVIGRAKLTDFMTAGADGSWVDIGPENEHAGALQEITSRTEYDKDGSNPAVITKVKLLSPIQAMQEIAKLQGNYAPEKYEHTGKDGGAIEIDYIAVLFNRITHIIKQRGSAEIPQHTQQ